MLILAYGEGDAWMSMHKHHEVIEIQDLLHKESWTTPIAPPKLSWGDPAPLAWGGRASALPAAAGALVVASADDATNGGASDNQGFLPVGPALTGNSLPLSPSLSHTCYTQKPNPHAPRADTRDSPFLSPLPILRYVCSNMQRAQGRAHPPSPYTSDALYILNPSPPLPPAPTRGSYPPPRPPPPLARAHRRHRPWLDGAPTRRMLAWLGPLSLRRLGSRRRSPGDAERDLWTRGGRKGGGRKGGGRCGAEYERLEWDRSFFFRPPTHFSHMSHPTFPISHIF